MIRPGWSIGQGARARACHKVNIHADKEEIMAPSCDYRVGAGFLVLTKGTALRPIHSMCRSSSLLPRMKKESFLDF